MHLPKNKWDSFPDSFLNFCFVKLTDWHFFCSGRHVLSLRFLMQQSSAWFFWGGEGGVGVDRRRGGRQGYCGRTEGGVRRVNWASFVFGTSQSASTRRGRSKSEYWMSQLRYGVSQGEKAERVIWGHSSVFYECGKGWKVPDHIQKKLNHRARRRASIVIWWEMKAEDHLLL